MTFDKEDARSLLEGEKVYPCYFPTNRSIKALIKNTKIAWDVLHKEKPDLIILICPLSSRQVKYLKVSDKNTYISVVKPWNCINSGFVKFFV